MDEFYSLGFLLNRASVSLSKALNAELAKENIDLPHSQFVVLRCLYYKDGLSQLEIANILFKDAAAIKRTIDNLEKKNLIERQQVRPLKNQIFITKQGKSIMPKVLKIANRIISQSCEGIDKTEYRLMRQMLETIFTNTDRS